MYCWEDMVAEVTAKKMKLELYEEGWVFKKYGVWVKCVPAGSDMLDCSACMFSAHCDDQRCVREYRTDGLDVIFRQATEEEIAECQSPAAEERDE